MDTTTIIIIAVLLITIAMLIATYVQMQSCSRVLEMIEDKGGPDAVCEWACMACEQLQESGVVK
jgi:hypothetical protein